MHENDKPGSARSWRMGVADLDGTSNIPSSIFTALLLLIGEFIWGEKSNLMS
jgi:hypothetical protein